MHQGQVLLHSEGKQAGAHPDNQAGRKIPTEALEESCFGKASTETVCVLLLRNRFHQLAHLEHGKPSS